MTLEVLIAILLACTAMIMILRWFSDADIPTGLFGIGFLSLLVCVLFYCACLAVWTSDPTATYEHSKEVAKWEACKADPKCVELVKKFK